MTCIASSCISYRATVRCDRRCSLLLVTVKTWWLITISSCSQVCGPSTLELKSANQARNAAVLQWHEAEEKALLHKRVDALKDHNMVEYKQLVQVGLCLLACGNFRNNDSLNA